MSSQYSAHTAHRVAVGLRAPERQAHADDCHDISQTTRSAMLSAALQQDVLLRHAEEARMHAEVETLQ